MIVSDKATLCIQSVIQTKAMKEFTLLIIRYQRSFNFQGWIACVAQVMDGVDLAGSVNRYFPTSGSNRGFAPSGYVNTFVMLLHEGGRCLEDVAI